jgi:DNA-binding NarL/FixJ family response regulator
MTLRCLLVDDNEAFLAAATVLLEREGMCVVGTASNTEDALRRARELRPDVAVVDISLGEESGLELARRLAAGGPPVILISTHAEADYEDLIRQTPAAGFVPKSELSSRAIERLLLSEPRGT